MGNQPVLTRLPRITDRQGRRAPLAVLEGETERAAEARFRGASRKRRMAQVGETCIMVTFANG